jgi:hypothetical protein
VALVSKVARKLSRLGEDGWVPAKVTELIVDFASPLLQSGGGPRSIQDVRNIMLLASVCWNLRVFERAHAPEFDELKELFDLAVNAMPEPGPSLLQRLVAEREAAFDKVPFAVLVDVRGTSLDDCRIHAEARQAPVRLLN